MGVITSLRSLEFYVPLLGYLYEITVKYSSRKGEHQFACQIRSHTLRIFVGFITYFLGKGGGGNIINYVQRMFCNFFDKKIYRHAIENAKK